MIIRYFYLVASKARLSASHIEDFCQIGLAVLNVIRLLTKGIIFLLREPTGELVVQRRLIILLKNSCSMEKNQ